MGKHRGRNLRKKTKKYSLSTPLTSQGPVRGSLAILGGPWFCFVFLFFFSSLVLASFLIGFFFDFGGILEAKMAPKIDFWSVFLDVLLEPSFLKIFLTFFHVFPLWDFFRPWLRPGPRTGAAVGLPGGFLGLSGPPGGPKRGFLGAGGGLPSGLPISPIVG